MAATSGRPAITLGPLEIAVGHPFGRGLVPATPHVPETAEAALREIVRSSFERPPVAVAFSGGRDSSALLALAHDVAREHGLPPPIAVTNVFGDPAAAESTWQQIVIEHLAIDDWVRLDASDVHATGPAARELYAREGLVFPSNAYTHIPLGEVVRGGTLITGAGGDELFASKAGTAWRLLGRHEPPSPRNLRRSLAELRPGRAGRAGRVRLAGRHWLTEQAATEIAQVAGRDDADTPLGYSTALRRWTSSRYFASVTQSFECVGRTAGCRVIAPFFHPRFISAWAREVGRVGPATRTAAMQQLFGSLLPTATLSRTSKALFTAALYRPDAEFLESWDGSGVPHDLVDADALRREWSSPTRHAGTALLYASAWFPWNASSGGSSADHDEPSR